MDTPQTDVPEVPVGRDRLADLLRGARQATGLDLGEVAARTNVRKEYLAALEEARYDELPEDIYAKNFVRLYAQTVGVPAAKALELYSRERRGVSSAASTAPEVQGERPLPRQTTPRRARPGLAVGAWLPTLLLVAAVVGLALWGFNNLLFRPARPAPPVVENTTADPMETAAADSDPATGEVANPVVAGAEVAGAGATDTAAPEAQTPNDSATSPLPDDSKSLFTLTTDPSGADVTVDGFPLPGATPIAGLPLTPGVGRTLRVTLPGFETYEAPIDVSTDLRLSLTLTPVGAAAGAGAGTEAAAEGETETATPAAPGQLTVRIDGTTWLEAYASTQRGVGERLVYTTVQPGATYTFDLPVYLHTGNAAGVLVTKDGQDLGAMGSSGEVVSRAYLP